MSKNLVIVESPAKAKTIENYLGKEFTVRSSFGHVRDLPKGDDAIDIENNFTPKYIISTDKKQIVSELKKLAKKAETIWLATDDDREGEAISWHLKEALKLNSENTKRIVFREITKNAILNAIKTPRDIDINLVNSQQARRILDRLVGFELSPVLWKKVKFGLSAGRVQSVAVRLVVEREREIDKFKTTPFFKVTAEFDLGNEKVLHSQLPKKFKTKVEAKEFLEKCLSADFSISTLEKKPSKKSPAAPFTTSTLQQEASRKMGFSVTQTMRVAQNLYEAGHISYMRTDSVNLSNDAVNAAANEIENTYGKEYVQTRSYKTKSKSAQEAHEAIRPTSFSNSSVESDRNEQRLYELIWKRAIASQMSNAILEKTIANIAISTTSENLVATGEMIKFDGFLKVYLESTDDEDEAGATKGVLPTLTEGQKLDLQHLKAVERFKRPSSRYTEASLVKKLEEIGIGRPSTYAPTISTVQKRGYVLKENRNGKERKYQELLLKDNKITITSKSEIIGTEKNKLFPTNIGMVVNDFLIQHFSGIMDYSFTAKVEEQFDIIANGDIQWNNMIGDFYGDFHKKVEDTTDVERALTGAIRDLGIDPKTKKPVYVKMGKYGAYAQLGENPEEVSKEKPTYASLRTEQLLESITLEDALELFKLPREVGLFEEKVVTATIGKFGPYIRHNGKFVSLSKELDPLSVNLEQAIGLILAKREVDAKKLIKEFNENPDIKILNGRWGPYISFKKKNFKIPKEREASKLTFEQTMELINNPPKKTKTKKKTTIKK